MTKSRKRNGGSADLRPIKVTLEPSDTTTVYYVNFFEVANTPYDFTLLGVRLPAKLPPARIADAQTSGSLTFEPDIQVVFPASIVPSLIQALTIQQKRYEEATGMTLPASEVTTT
jgi:hypothetical protein